jgi:hypothetical protein
MDFISQVSIYLNPRTSIGLIASHIAKHKYTLLTPNEKDYVPDMTSNSNRMEVRRNWDKLMPREQIVSFSPADDLIRL